MAQEIFYAMALTRLTNFNYQQALELYKAVGSAQLLFEHRNEIGDIIKDASPRLMEALKDWDEPMRRAECEMKFMEEHRIRGLTLTSDDYPQRLAECPDAPIIIYYTGNADLNQAKIVSIVGTRQITQYGQDLIRHFISDLRRQCPQVLIVSGLAYGIDICAHRNALDSGFETVGVLAHGLDELYPSAHRETAKQMLLQGGLLTEYMSETRVDKQNFVRRNRIVAGMCDATVLVESAAKGGGLITARIAQDYNRSVFAFPGAVGAKASEGCNNLIRNNGATLITCADDFASDMGWQNDAQLNKARREGIERTAFPNLSEEEDKVVKTLEEMGDVQLNVLSVRTNIPIGQLTALLFQLEMKGVVRPMAGGSYHLMS